MSEFRGRGRGFRGAPRGRGDRGRGDYAPRGGGGSFRGGRGDYPVDRERSRGGRC